MRNPEHFGFRAAAVAVISVCVMCALSAAAHAGLAIDDNRYCSAGANAASTADTVPGSLLSVNDVKLTITGTPPQYTASDCYGDFGIQSQNPTDETNALNAIFGATSGLDQFLYLDRFNSDNSPAPSSTTGLGGITFVVETLGGSNGAPGTWLIAWTDTNAAAPQNLPLTIDLALLLMGGNNMAAYLLSNVILPLSPTNGTGMFDIQFLNPGGNQPMISHLTLAGRVVPARPTNVPVPEPATLAMFGAGLLALCTVRRRHFAQAGLQGSSPTHAAAVHQRFVGIITP
jgi:hypothetical protein